MVNCRRKQIKQTYFCKDFKAKRSCGSIQPFVIYCFVWGQNGALFIKGDFQFFKNAIFKLLRNNIILF